MINPNESAPAGGAANDWTPELIAELLAVMDKWGLILEERKTRVGVRWDWSIADAADLIRHLLPKATGGELREPEWLTELREQLPFAAMKTSFFLTRDELQWLIDRLNPAIAPGGDDFMQQTVAQIMEAGFRVTVEREDQADENERLAALPAAGNAGAVDDAMVERATKAYCDWFGPRGEGVNTLALRAALTAALYAAPQDGAPAKRVIVDYNYNGDPVYGDAPQDGEADQPVGDGWLPWSGGKCPVPYDSRVEFRMRDPDRVFTSPASELDWSHGQGLAPDAEIIAYRIAAQEAARG